MAVQTRPGIKQSAKHLTDTESNSASSTTNTESLFEPFWQAWDIVHQYYVDQPVDELKLMQGAIRGMMEALGDHHSTYMDPVQYKDATSDLSGEYEGIGAL
jgi:carboxyl-terminal processing protease